MRFGEAEASLHQQGVACVQPDVANFFHDPLAVAAGRDHHGVIHMPEAPALDAFAHHGTVLRDHHFDQKAARPA